MQQNEAPEEKVPVVECLDGPARITSKELATTHFVKSGTLQNACSTRPRVVVGLVKSAQYAHCQVDEQPTKRSKKNDDKSAVAFSKKDDWHERGPVTDQGHDRSGKPGKKCDNKLHRRSSQRRSSNARQLGLRISRHDAAEAYSPEEHRHAETSPTCEIHKGYCASR